MQIILTCVSEQKTNVKLHLKGGEIESLHV